MTTLATMMMAATAAESAVIGTPEMAGGGWISGDTLTTVLSILAGAGGIVGGKMWGDRTAKKDEQKIRAEVAEELKAKLVNDPLHVEQSNYQATMKENAADHNDMFTRLRTVETEIAAVKATMAAKFDSMSGQLMETKEMVRQLFDRICKGRK